MRVCVSLSEPQALDLVNRLLRPDVVGFSGSGD